MKLNKLENGGSYAIISSKIDVSYKKFWVLKFQNFGNDFFEIYFYFLMKFKKNCVS